MPGGDPWQCPTSYPSKKKDGPSQGSLLTVLKLALLIHTPPPAEHGTFPGFHNHIRYTRHEGHLTHLVGTLSKVEGALDHSSAGSQLCCLLTHNTRSAHSCPDPNPGLCLIGHGPGYRHLSSLLQVATAAHTHTRTHTAVSLARFHGNKSGRAGQSKIHTPFAGHKASPSCSFRTSCRTCASFFSCCTCP